MKNTLINIGLAITSIIAFFLVIEFGLRITGLQTTAPNPPKIYERSGNANISYKLKSNLEDEPAYKATVSTDALGFRTNGSDRITNHQSPITIILGDSITFGYGVHDNETLAARLEQITSNSQPSILHSPFVNAAVPGYQLQQERALFENYGRQLTPHAVIIVFYWNDLDGLKPGMLDDDGILRAHGWQPTEPQCSPIERGIMRFIPGKCWLDLHSAFYKAAKKVVNLRTGKRDQEEQRQEASLEHGDDVNIVHLDTYINDLHTFAKILPTDRTFVIWPDNGLHEETKPRLMREAKSAGFRVIDLYELFGNDVETLPWDTVHPSSAAIEKAAKYIVERLE